MPNLGYIARSVIKEWGVPVYWITSQGASIDLDTGHKTDNTSERKIRKVLILPEQIKEKFTYDLSYIAASSNFIQGGFYQKGTLSIAVMKKDLPTYSRDDRVRINGSVYRISAAFDNPNGVWGFNLTDIKDAKPDS